MEPLEAIAMLEKASTPAEIFPAKAGMDKRYHDLLKIVHPDRFPASLSARADAAARKLADFYSQVRGYKATTSAIVGKWVVSGPRAEGHICDLYDVEKDSGKGVLKIVCDASNNDLIEVERLHLMELHTKPASPYARYLPILLDSFKASGKDCNVLSPAEGCYSLAELAAIFGYSLDFRHTVWMMNRLLSLLGYIHGLGMVHGGILPEHLLYRPSDHGLVVVGWCSSVKENGHIPLLVKERESFYPKEVKKKLLRHTTDIYMAARSILYAVSDIPEKFRPLLDWCLADSPGARPTDCWEFQDRWKETAKAVYGEPKFLKMDIPIT